MDTLTALSWSQQEYRECSLKIFSESWLHTDIPEHNVTISEFQTVRANRDCSESSEHKGGGFTAFVNNRGCNPGHITIKDHTCSPDTGLLAVGLPHYLPHEISHAIVVAVYMHPSANPTSACDVIHKIISKLQIEHPIARITISSDFNHVSIAKTLPKFTQYESWKTREEKTLHLLYVKGAYSPLLPSGKIRSQFGASHTLPCASGEKTNCDLKGSEEMDRGQL